MFSLLAPAFHNHVLPVTASLPEEIVAFTRPASLTRGAPSPPVAQ
jgi:hypothetical protein